LSHIVEPVFGYKVFELKFPPVTINLALRPFDDSPMMLLYKVPRSGLFTDTLSSVRLTGC